MRKLLVLSVAVALVFAVALPAMAQDRTVNIYGSARMETFIQDHDREFNLFGPGGNGLAFDDSDLIWRMDESSSRFGARFKAGDVGGNVEIRSNFGGNIMRHWYGTWNFGPGTLVVGQTWTPSFIPICDECMIGGGGFPSGYGDTGGGGPGPRRPQIQVNFPMKMANGTLTFAALQPNTNTVSKAPFNVDTDTTLPRLEGKLTFATGMISGAVVLGYGTFDVVNALDGDQSVDSFFATANVTGSFGPFWASVAGGFGQNMADYNYAGSVLFANILNNSINDVDQTRAAAEVGFNMSDTLAFFVNWATLSEQRDNVLGDDEDDKSFWAVGAKITVAKGFTMTPEVVKTDEGERTTNGVKGPDRGSRTFYGIYWQIDF